MFCCGEGEPVVIKMDTFEKLYREDQRHISLWEKNYTNKEFFDINKKLRKRLEKLIGARKNLSPKEYFICAMIYHHGFSLNSSRKALKYIRKAQGLGYMRNRGVFGSIVDRLLQLQGKPQKYGTQIVILKNGEFKKSKNGKYIQYKLDGTISDKKRVSLGLPKLKNLKKYLENKEICSN